MKNLKNSYPKVLHNYLEAFIDTLTHSKKFSKHTCNSYALDIKQFAAFWEQHYKNFHLTQLDHEMADRYLVFLYEAGLSRKSIARKISALRLFYDHLKLQQDLAKNPFKGLKIKALNQEIPKTIPEHILRNFLDTLKGESFIAARQHFCAECLYSTGIRVSELVQIDLRDIQTDDACVVKGKGAKERLIWFSPLLKKVLDIYLGYRSQIKSPKSEALLLSQKGLRLSARQVQRDFVAMRQRCHLPEWFSPHSLRHAFASSILNQGAPLAVVKDLLGHESIQSTAIYTHVNLEALKTKMDSLNE